MTKVLKVQCVLGYQGQTGELSGWDNIDGEYINPWARFTITSPWPQ